MALEREREYVEEAEWARALTPRQVADQLWERQRAMREADETWLRAKALGLVTVVTVNCPQCWTILEIPDDAIQAICGNCMACIQKHGSSGMWEVHG